MSTNQYHVSVGYHSFELKVGWSIKLDKSGEIILISSTGKEHKTDKNVKVAPASYRGKVLAGDIVSSVVRAAYQDKDAPSHPIFAYWQGLCDIGGIPDFKKFKKSNGGQQRFYFDLKPGMRLIAEEKNPTTLLYAIVNGREVYPVSSTHIKEIPATVGYIEKAHHDRMEFLRAEERNKMAALEAGSLKEERRTKADLARERRNANRAVALALAGVSREVRIALIKNLRDLPINLQKAQKAYGTPLQKNAEKKDITALEQMISQDFLREEIATAWETYKKEHHIV